MVLATLALIDRIGRRKGGRGGVIVNISSIVGLFNLDAPIYCSTKHAVVSFTRTMRVHLYIYVCIYMKYAYTNKRARINQCTCVLYLQKQFEITGARVVAICPGLTETSLVTNHAGGLEYTDYGGVKNYPTQSLVWCVYSIFKWDLNWSANNFFSLGLGRRRALLMLWQKWKIINWIFKIKWSIIIHFFISVKIKISN